jgi:hypothetical protein
MDFTSYFPRDSGVAAVARLSFANWDNMRVVVLAMTVRQVRICDSSN